MWKVGCGKKKILLLLRKELGKFLLNEKEKGKKYKKIEIK